MARQAFNDNAAPVPDSGMRPESEKLLAVIEKTRLGLALQQAVAENDLARATELHAAGGDPMLRDGVTFKALQQMDTVAAQRLLAAMKVPSYYGRAAEAPFIRAAETGNITTLEDGFARGASHEAVSAALAAALKAGNDSIADLILTHIELKDVTDTGLRALLRWRPATYDAAVDADRRDMPDYIGHFYSALTPPDAAAMERALDRMVANKGKLPLYVLMGYDEMDGGGRYSDLAYQTLATGETKVIDRLLEHFGSSLPATYTLLHMAAGMGEKQPQLLPHLLETLKVDEYAVTSALRALPRNADSELIEYFLREKKELVIANPLSILGALAAKPDGTRFVEVAEDPEIFLPTDEKEQGNLLRTAIAGSKTAADWLLAHITLTPQVLDVLRGGYEETLLKKAAELGGTTRFGDDVLYWNALRDNDAAYLAAIPRTPKISTGSPWRVGAALIEVVRRGDFDALRDAIDNSDWTKDSLKQLWRATMRSEAALEIVAEKKLLPATLDDISMHDIAEGGGARVLQWLTRHGLTPDDKQQREALRVALHKNNHGMAEFLLDAGADIAGEFHLLESAVTRGPDMAGLAQLEKILVREQRIAAPGLDAALESQSALFSGPESPAVAAAYADRFAEVMTRAGNITPDVLVTTTDKHGNTLLEILGAHGRLNDALTLPAMWRDTDAVAFIESHTPQHFHAQVDYSGLKAALDRLKLAEQAKGGRFRLKGP